MRWTERGDRGIEENSHHGLYEVAMMGRLQEVNSPFGLP